MTKLRCHASNHAETAPGLEEFESHPALAACGQAAHRPFDIAHVRLFIATGYRHAAVEPELELTGRLQALLHHELDHFHARVAVVTVATEDVVRGNYAVEEICVNHVVLRPVMRNLENVHLESAIAVQAACFRESLDEVIPAAVSGQQDLLAALLDEQHQRGEVRRSDAGGIPDRFCLQVNHRKQLIEVGSAKCFLVGARLLL